MKEMYLKVEVTQYDDYGEIFEVFYRNGRSFYTRKGDEKLVDIKDAEERGAEKLCKAISDICFSDGVDIKNAFDGYCGMTGIIGNFKPEEIVQRAEKLNVHVPTTGDIYVSRKSGNKVAVLVIQRRDTPCAIHGRFLYHKWFGRRL